MFSIFKLLFFYFPKMSIENKKAKSSKPVTRKLIKKELCNDESGKNASEIIDMAISVLEGIDNEIIMPEAFTRGHFTRGVE